MTAAKTLSVAEVLHALDDLRLSKSERNFVSEICLASKATLDANGIRAEVVRRLCLLAAAPDWGQVGRLCIEGGAVNGDLDLVGTRLDFGLWFEDVEFGGLLLNDTRLLAFELLGGSATTVRANRIEIEHDLVIGRGFTCAEGVGLRSATIGGDLNLSGARLEAKEGSSLNFDGARIGARVFLRTAKRTKTKPEFPFRAAKPVRGRNARVGGGILCAGGNFDLELNLSRTQVEGDVNLNGAKIATVPWPGEHEEPELNLNSMRIAGELSLKGTDFCGKEISMARTQVDGSYSWALLRSEPHDTRLYVDLEQTRVGYLNDLLDHWHNAEVTLGGFSIGGIAVGEKDWLEKRRTWLRHQPPGRWSFHPYDQVRRALRDSGHEKMAREIAVERENIRLDRGGLGRLGKLVHCLYGKLLGYGYRPLRFFGVSALIVLIFAAIFWTIDPCELPYAGDTCGGFVSPPSGAPPEHAVLFSLDAFVPVDLGQTGAWQPTQALYSYLVAVETLMGWLFTAVLIGAVTGVLRRD